MAISLWTMFLGGSMTLFCGSTPPRHEEHAVATVTHEADHDAAGLRALAAGDAEKAEREFARSGNDLRRAEALILLGRREDAEALLLALNDGQAKFLLGWIARERGNHKEARRLFARARALGSDTGAAALAAYYPGART